MRILEKCNRTTRFLCTSVALFYSHATETRFFSNFCCTFLLACNRTTRFLCTSVALFYSRATEHALFQQLLLHSSTRMQQNNTISLHFCCIFLLACNRTTRFFCTSVALFYSRATEHALSSIFCCIDMESNCLAFVARLAVKFKLRNYVCREYMYVFGRIFGRYKSDKTAITDVQIEIVILQPLQKALAARIIQATHQIQSLF